eukprot:4795216-Pleurochrysis_carterae.AAC.1
MSSCMSASTSGVAPSLRVMRTVTETRSDWSGGGLAGELPDAAARVDATEPSERQRLSTGSSLSSGRIMHELLWRSVESGLGTQLLRLLRASAWRAEPSFSAAAALLLSASRAPLSFLRSLRVSLLVKVRLSPAGASDAAATPAWPRGDGAWPRGDGMGAWLRPEVERTQWKGVAPASMPDVKERRPSAPREAGLHVDALPVEQRRERSSSLRPCSFAASEVDERRAQEASDDRRRPAGESRASKRGKRMTERDESSRAMADGGVSPSVDSGSLTPTAADTAVTNELPRNFGKPRVGEPGERPPHTALQLAALLRQVSLRARARARHDWFAWRGGSVLAEPALEALRGATARMTGDVSPVLRASGPPPSSNGLSQWPLLERHELPKPIGQMAGETARVLNADASRDNGGGS